MKALLLFVLILSAFAATSQELVFKMNQYGVSHKNNEGRFSDAIIKNEEIVITLQDKVVKVNNDNTSELVLEKMINQNNNIKHLYSQAWKGFDNKKTPVQFKFTVNIESKEAMVELGYRNYKQYFFGKYNYGNLQELKKENSQAKAFR